MSTLLELSKEIAIIESELEDQPENTEELIKRLTSLDIEAAQKVSAVTQWVKSLEVEQDAIDAELKRLQARKKARVNKEAALRSFLAFAFNALGIKQFKNERFTVSLLAPRESCVVEEHRVHESSAEFFDAAVKAGAIVEAYKVDKNKLKLVPGWQDQPWVTIVTGEESIQIR